MSKLVPITIDCTRYDRTKAIKDGRIRVDGCEVTYLPLDPEAFVRRQLGDLRGAPALLRRKVLDTCSSGCFEISRSRTLQRGEQLGQNAATLIPRIETEIPKVGDFVSRNMGHAPVVVVRDNDGTIHGLLNSCRHRGAKVCRADSGNTRHFVCPYHGWTYERSGRLVTTTFDKHFPEGFDFSDQGLPRIPRLEIHKGLVFGSWSESVEPLSEYLGDIAWYIDPFLSRSPGGMEVLAPPHRWRRPAIAWRSSTSRMAPLHP